MTKKKEKKKRNFLWNHANDGGLQTGFYRFARRISGFCMGKYITTCDWLKKWQNRKTTIYTCNIGNGPWYTIQSVYHITKNRCLLLVRSFTYTKFIKISNCLATWYLHDFDHFHFPPQNYYVMSTCTSIKSSRFPHIFFLHSILFLSLSLFLFSKFYISSTIY